MAFPTTSVLDAFTGSDGNLGSPNWSVSLFGESPPRRVSNQVRPASGGAWSPGLWLPNTSFGPDQEVYFDLVSLASGWDIGLYLRTSDTVFTNSVWVGISSGSVIVDCAGSASVSGTTSASVAWAAGDKVGVSLIGTTLNVYRYTSSAWNQTPVLSCTVSGLSSAGRIGFWVADGGAATTTIDNFGGGTVVTAVTGSARLSGGGTLRGAGAKSAASVGRIIGGGAVSGAGAKRAASGGRLIGGGDLRGAGAKRASSGGRVVGGGAVTGAGAKSSSSTCRVVGGGTLSGLGAKASGGTARTIGGGVLAGFGSKSTSSTGVITGGGSITGTGTAIRSASGNGFLTGGGGMSGWGTKATSGAGRIVGGGNITATGGSDVVAVPQVDLPSFLTIVRTATSLSIARSSTGLTVARRETDLSVVRRETLLEVDG